VAAPQSDPGREKEDEAVDAWRNEGDPN